MTFIEFNATMRRNQWRYTGLVLTHLELARYYAGRADRATAARLKTAATKLANEELSDALETAQFETEHPALRILDHPEYMTRDEERSMKQMQRRWAGYIAKADAASRETAAVF